MNSFHVVVARDDNKEGMDPTVVGLLVFLLVLVFLGLALIGALLFLRHMRKAKKEAELPLYEKRQSGHRRLTITTSSYGKGRESILVIQEKQDLIANSSSPPSTPKTPEIRITFPDEIDESGKQQPGRVLVVRVGEHNVGLEPLDEDQLPPYQRDSSDRFDSLDLDRIGGLKEKSEKDYS